MTPRTEAILYILSTLLPPYKFAMIKKSLLQNIEKTNMQLSAMNIDQWELYFSNAL